MGVTPGKQAAAADMDWHGTVVAQHLTFLVGVAFGRAESQIALHDAGGLERQAVSAVSRNETNRAENDHRTMAIETIAIVRIGN